MDVLCNFFFIYSKHLVLFPIQYCYRSYWFTESVVQELFRLSASVHYKTIKISSSGYLRCISKVQFCPAFISYIYEWHHSVKREIEIRPVFSCWRFSGRNANYYQQDYPCYCFKYKNSLLKIPVRNKFSTLDDQIISKSNILKLYIHRKFCL